MTNLRNIDIVHLLFSHNDESDSEIESNKRDFSNDNSENVLTLIILKIKKFEFIIKIMYYTN